VNDMKELLTLALDEGPAPGGAVDPSGDLERGRKMLRRRRTQGIAGVTSVLVIGALVPLALNGSGAAGSGGVVARNPTAARQTTAGMPTSKSRPSVSSGGSIALVTWTGTQPPGYRVSWMPKGWVVQGSTPSYLTIAPAGDKDTSADSFLGKLVVMLQSADATSPPTGTSQPVNGRPGFLESAAQAGGGTEILTFKVADGKWAQVQAPMSLRWNGPQLAKFASGVQVLGAAEAGHG
jgi:hypothetical protein